MFTVLCLDKNWLTSKDAFSIYAPCMYQPTFDDFIAQTDDDAIGFYRRSGFEAEKVVIEYPDGAAVRYNCVLYNESSKKATED